MDPTTTAVAQIAVDALDTNLKLLDQLEAERAKNAAAPPPEPLPQSLAGLTAMEMAFLAKRAPEHYKKLMDEKARRAAGGFAPRGPETRDTVVVPPGANTPWGRTLPPMTPEKK